MCVIEGLDTPDAQKTLNTHFFFKKKKLKKDQSKDSKPLYKEIQTPN